MIPSGILCTAIASATIGPTSVSAENPTAKPSGKLCSVIVTDINTPSRSVSAGSRPDATTDVEDEDDGADGYDDGMLVGSKLIL